MNTVCKILFSIELLHDYYNQQVPFNDIEIIPDDKTIGILQGHKILWKKFKNRLVALSEVDGAKPLINIAAETKLRFYLKIKNPVFANISSLKFFDTENKIYYFTNKANNEKDGKFYLSKPIAAYDAAKDYEMGLMVSNGTKVFEAIQSVSNASPHFTSDADFWRELTPSRFPLHHLSDHADINKGTIVFNTSDSKMYEALKIIPAENSVGFADVNFWREVKELGYVTDEDLVDKTDDILDKKTENNIAEKIFGVVDLFFDVTVPASYSMLDGGGAVKEINYLLRFKNRISTWKYISQLNTLEKIIDTNGVFDFNSQFTSKTPVPLMAVPTQNFQLKKVASSITKNNIKCASADIKPDDATQSFFSEIFLNF